MRREFITHWRDMTARGGNMKADVFFVTGCIALALLVSGGSAQTEPLATKQLAPDEFKWDQTPFGGQRVTLVRDEQKPGMYVYRVRFPANFKVHSGQLQSSAPFPPDERVGHRDVRHLVYGLWRTIR